MNNAGLLAAGAYVLVIALVMALLQRVDETPQIDLRDKHWIVVFFG
jgi:hypothetical protein